MSKRFRRGFTDIKQNLLHKIFQTTVSQNSDGNESIKLETNHGKQRYDMIRGESQMKNVTKSGKSPKGGGGVSDRNQKVHNSKCGLFYKRGGGHIFIFFPNVNVEFKCFS